MALLNSFEFVWDGERVQLPLPAQRLVAFLALQDRPVRRAYVAGTLWFEATEGRALGSLRSALWRLRQHGYELVEATSLQLRLAPGVAVDLHEAVALAHSLLAASAELEDVDLEQPGLSGDLLPDWYDDWVQVERECFHDLRVRTLESLCARLTEAGKFDKAMEAGWAAVKGEPLRESAHRSLISVHLAEGNGAEALRRYRLYRRLVHDRFGIEPSERMEDLVCELKTASRRDRTETRSPSRPRT
jgi:DNA-binding SARP family transcriptional activator